MTVRKGSDKVNTDRSNEMGIVEEKPRPSIFSEEQTWFRSEKYEVFEYQEHIYIKPVEKARVEEYNPYDKALDEKHPRILIDFFDILQEMQDKIMAKFGDTGRMLLASLDPVGKKVAYQILLDCAKILVKFYNKYGPLGVFFEDILDIRLREEGESPLILTKQDTFYTRKRSYLPPKTNPTDLEIIGVYDYERYAIIFFPWLKQAPNLYRQAGFYDRLHSYDYRLSPDFMNHYSEEMNLIIYHELLMKLNEIINTLKELEQKGKRAKSTAKQGALFLDVSFPLISEPPINTYMLTLLRDGSRVKIGWKANSLMGMLVLMFIENVAKQRNDNLSVCKLKECNRLAIGRAEYCCDTHGSRHRQRTFNENPENIKRRREKRAREREMKKKLKDSNRSPKI